MPGWFVNQRQTSTELCQKNHNGDINSLHPLHTHSDLGSDARGNKFTDPISYSDLVVIIDPAPKRIAEETTSFPDMTLVYPNFLTSINWGTITALGYDHIHVHNIRTPTPQTTNRTFVNFANAQLDGLPH